MKEKELESLVVELLWQIWKGISPDYKSKYRRNIWEQFENLIASSTMTNTLRKFFTQVNKRQHLSIPTEEVEGLSRILNRSNSKELLSYLRENLNMIILLVRLKNDKKNQEWKEKQEKKDENLFV